MEYIMEEPHLNIDELYETKRKSDLNRLNIYSKLLNKIHTKIKVASKQRNNNQFCSFVMPEVLLGYPNYNFAECLTYILDRLDKDGFSTRYIHPNLIFIAWSHWVPEYVREELQKKTKLNVDSFGNTIEKKEKNVVKFEKSESKPISNYKPSGLFVYDDEMIQSMKIK
jgi:hypothetical protein